MSRRQVAGLRRCQTMTGQKVELTASKASAWNLYEKKTKKKQKTKKNKNALTVIVLVNNGDSGPIEVGHYVLISGVQQTLCRIQVYADFLSLGVQIQPGLQVRYVQGIAYTVNVLTQDWIRRAE